MAFTPLEATRDSREASPGQRHRRTRLARKKKGSATGYLFLLPWFIGMFVFTAGPVIASLYLSFTNYNLIGSAGWIGWQNYLAMFQDPQWWDSVRVTFVYVVVSVPLKLAFALLVAMLLKRGLVMLGLFRAIYYVPSLLGSSVAIALLWRQIFDSDGLVNQALNLIGDSLDLAVWHADADLPGRPATDSPGIL
jgi:multiple sugar transport system permease protein